MASFNDLLASAIIHPGGKCAVGAWRDTLNPADREAFDIAAGTPSVPHAALHRAMKAMGFPASDSPVQRHRSGGCKCPASQTN